MHLYRNGIWRVCLARLTVYFQTTFQVLPNQILYCWQKKLRWHYPPELYMEWILDTDFICNLSHFDMFLIFVVFFLICVVLIFGVALILVRQRAAAQKWGTILPGLYWCHQKYSSQIVRRVATYSIRSDKTPKDTHTQTDIQRSSHYMTTALVGATVVKQLKIYHILVST